MGSQSLCCSLTSPKIIHSSSKQTALANAVIGRDCRVRLTNAANSNSLCGLRWSMKESFLSKVKGVSRICASSSDSDLNLGVSPKGYNGIQQRKFGGIEPFQGKSGSVSFHGVTHHLIEESKLVSSPIKQGSGGSLLWVLAPLVLILSLILPPLLISNAVDAVFKNVFVAELVASLSCEAIFYVGVAIFVLITDWVQRPHLQLSAKRWDLITGLKGLLATMFFSAGLKVVAPVVITYVTWPFLGVQALIAVAPLLVGFLAQLALETFVDKKGSSCWPIVYIICEVYRLYQLTKASHFIERLMFAMRGAELTPALIDRSGALVAMLVTFQAVGLVCLWSLLTFLLRLYPALVAEKKY